MHGSWKVHQALARINGALLSAPRSVSYSPRGKTFHGAIKKCLFLTWNCVEKQEVQIGIINHFWRARRVDPACV